MNSQLLVCLDLMNIMYIYQVHYLPGLRSGMKNYFDSDSLKVNHSDSEGEGGDLVDIGKRELFLRLQRRLREA